VSQQTRLDRSGRIGIAHQYLRIVVQAVLLFGSAGRLDWGSAWIYLGLATAFVTALDVLLLRRDPALLNARGALQAGAARWDLVLVAGAFLTSYAGLVVAGLDAGRSGTSSLSPELVAVAGVVFVASALLIGWAMLENANFEALVRIQSDRGHPVCRSGPYAFVRHPGYLGMIAGVVATPLILGSLPALIPAGASALLLLWRTALEDRTLQRELAGYADYASVTRYRLLPRVW
jgi:protein-S-isoprenylcysteine O-methyltransferase Ste14